MGSKMRLSSYCTKPGNNTLYLVTSRKTNTRLARPISVSFSFPFLALNYTIRIIKVVTFLNFNKTNIIIIHSSLNNIYNVTIYLKLTTSHPEICFVTNKSDAITCLVKSCPFWPLTCPDSH